ncbi:MAG: hypothetical protein H6739_08420 [Alphaproteobacteria bacterium]|nr:hypothetical protein [Alphaproteobacteria bacterium]
MPIMHHTQLSEDHLAGNGGLGRYVLLPGDPARAALLAAQLHRVERVENPRGHTAYLGRLGVGPGVDVLVTHSGMGTGSTEVILHELLEVGARRVLRVGSCGAMVEGVRPGGVVIVTGAVRDEATTSHYAPPGFPALAAPDCVAAMTEGARRAGLAEHTWRGLCHTKASLWAREFGHGPNGAANLDYKHWLARCGVIASEMEAAAIFVMCHTRRPAPVAPVAGGSRAVHAQGGAVLAVYADATSDMELSPAVIDQANQRAAAVALHGLVAWAEADGVG